MTATSWQKMREAAETTRKDARILEGIADKLDAVVKYVSLVANDTYGLEDGDDVYSDLIGMAINTQEKAQSYRSKSSDMIAEAWLLDDEVACLGA